MQLEVGAQNNYTTGLPPSPARHVHQPLYFGKIPGNIIAFHFFMYLLAFFPFQNKGPIHVCSPASFPLF